MMSSITRLIATIKKVEYKLSLALGEFILNKAPLGQGGNGVVYEASINGHTVAIKFLVTDAVGKTKEQKIQRFLAEYFNIITIEDQTSIVRYIDYDLYTFEDDEGFLSVPVIVMTKYDSSLSKKQEGRTEDKFKRIFDFLIQTVKRLHKVGIIHRDIKPENILVNGSKLYLADFGIASYNPELFKISAETEKKERLGNRLFSAPEQEDSGINADPTMDIYAIGQVLQWYASGKTHRGTGRVSITAVFPELGIYDRIIEKCLKQNSENRFQNIEEIEEYLKQSREKNFWEYLYLFHDVCVSSFPRNDEGVIYSSDKIKIDRLLNSFKEKESEFENTLWWVDGNGSMDFTLEQKGSGIWTFLEWEYDISDIWIHYDSSRFNDFILIYFQKGQSFFIEEKERFDAVIVDNKFFISNSEYNNGYAEIDDKIIDLSNHTVKHIVRQETSGYFFIGQAKSCIIQPENDKEIREFIENLLATNRKPTIEELRLFQRKIQKNKDDEVRDSL